MNIRTRRLLLLALPPLVGCALVARISAGRPERQILGKWKVSHRHAIEFHGNGSYIEERREADGRKVSVRRRSGAFEFLSRNRLKLQPFSYEVDGESIFLGGSAGTTPVEMDVEISGDQANVAGSLTPEFYSPMWRRIP